MSELGKYTVAHLLIFNKLLLPVMGTIPNLMNNGTPWKDCSWLCVCVHGGSVGSHVQTVFKLLCGFQQVQCGCFFSPSGVKHSHLCLSGVKTEFFLKMPRFLLYKYNRSLEVFE